MTSIERIRQKIRSRDYWLSSHAEEEMFDDDLERDDIEHALLHGKVEKRFTRDARGVRYRVVGPTTDGRVARVVCRFLADENLLIITAYAEE